MLQDLAFFRPAVTIGRDKIPFFLDLGSQPHLARQFYSNGRILPTLSPWDCSYHSDFVQSAVGMKMGDAVRFSLVWAIEKPPCGVVGHSRHRCSPLGSSVLWTLIFGVAMAGGRDSNGSKTPHTHRWHALGAAFFLSILSLAP